ncbi:sugar phosphate nucleotidyltransferase [Pseudodesulfovibrio karagichevae]|uniref:Sugar phosphate nucleotidyltransferase n=1 Tax=Pseudodesulfovibrio karagichevae TaxID=3239305 RepID=A0ABV4K4N0_9BACT
MSIDLGLVERAPAKPGGFAPVRKTMVRQAVILAGGRGTRLGELTREVPKPVIPVGGVPFLSYLIWNLARHGIREIVLSTGYLHEKLRDALGDGRELGVRLSYVREREPLGTGGGVRNCLGLLDETFLVLNGDSIFDINYLDLAAGAQGNPRIALRRVEDASRFGTVRHRSGRVVQFSEKGAGGPGAINGGIYLLTREVVRELPEGAVSLEQDVFPELAARGRLFCKEYSGFFLDIGVPEDLARAQTDVPAWRRKPALFLDRDVVVEDDSGHGFEDGDFAWRPGVCEAVKAANDAGWLVFAVSARPDMGGRDCPGPDSPHFEGIAASGLADAGAHFDAVYHYPREGRSPAPAMLAAFGRDWNVDMAASAMIGGSSSGVSEARRAGVGRWLLHDREPDDLRRLVLSIL